MFLFHGSLIVLVLLGTMFFLLSWSILFFSLTIISIRRRYLNQSSPTPCIFQQVTQVVLYTQPDNRQTRRYRQIKNLGRSLGWGQAPNSKRNGIPPMRISTLQETPTYIKPRPWDSWIRSHIGNYVALPKEYSYKQTNGNNF
jgi:hypothetical protein